MRKLLALILTVGILGSSVEPLLAGKSYSSGRSSGGGSFRSSSGGSSSRSSSSRPSPSRPSWKPSSKPSGKGASGFSDSRRSTPSESGSSRRYSSGGSGGTGGFSNPRDAGGSGTPSARPQSKPFGKDYFNEMARAQAEQESKARFRMATSPKPTYTDPKGNQHPINPDAKPVETLRRSITPEKYHDRERRARNVFDWGPSYNPRSVPQYGDPFGPWFYLWLFERASAQERANWAYNHRSQIDSERWNDMVRRDAQLEARVRQLESQNVPRDPAYVPPALQGNPDLMYNNDYVTAVVNPQPVEAGRRAGFPWGAVFVALVLAMVLFIVGRAILKAMLERRKSMAAAATGTRAGRTEMYNPLSAKCGSFVAVDELDFRGKEYRIVEIRQYDHAIGGRRFQLTDYVLRAGEEVVRLRVVPGGKQWRPMLLTLYDDLAYDQGLHDVVRDDTLKFVVDDAEAGLHEEYWRVEEVRDSYKARVTVLCGNDASAPQSAAAEVEYWDYWRDTEVDGAKVTQYLYVEMNLDTGWFQIWRGMETDPERIMVT
jgi:hypothetical protein